MFTASRQVKMRAMIAGVILVLCYLWFMLCEQQFTRPQYIMYHRLDDFIPFVPAFIVPYYLWYLYMILPMIWLFFVSPENFIKGLAFYALCLIVACTIYTLVPNGQRLRVGDLSGGFFESWVAFTYSIDTPTNVAPSLHVMDSLAVHLTLIGYEKFRKCKPAVVISAIIAFFCSISTVFVKQHSIIDVLVALPLTAIIWFGIYGQEWKRRISQRRRRALSRTR